MTVSLLDNALATDVVIITISMLSQDGEVYATEDLEISVVATYGIADVKLSEQEGRPSTEVISNEVTNTGNKEDLFQFMSLLILK